jgi:hypothetical protein
MKQLACTTTAHLTSSLPVTAAHLVKDDGVRPADLVPSPCPWKGCRLVYVTGTGLAACTFCSSLFSWAAAGESGGSSCLRSSSDFRRRSNFRLDSARLACACKGRTLISITLRIHMCEASAKETEWPIHTDTTTRTEPDRHLSHVSINICNSISEYTPFLQC